MRTGESGRTAIAWTQTELDGLEAAPLARFVVGASWSWRGRSVALTGADALGVNQLAFPNAASLLSDRIHAAAIEDARLGGASVEITNGARRFVADLVWIEGEDLPVLVFDDGCPEKGQDFWVSKVSDLSNAAGYAHPANETVVAFPVQRSVADIDLNPAQPLVLTAAE